MDAINLHIVGRKESLKTRYENWERGVMFSHSIIQFEINTHIRIYQPVCLPLCI